MMNSPLARKRPVVSIRESLSHRAARSLNAHTLPRVLLVASLLPGALLLKGCGGKKSTSHPDVVGGEIVTAANAKGPAYTSTVAITFTRAALGGKSYCSGTLIDAKRGLVLSAAHCFEELAPGEKQYVFFGTQLSTRTPAQFRRIRALVRHQGYDPALTLQQARYRTPSNDLAMVRFEGVTPGGFSEAPLATADIAAPRAFLLAGFGITGTLARASSGRALVDEFGLPVTKSDTGTLRMVEVAKTGEYAGGKVFNVGGAKPQGACPGDSGGPLYGENGTAPASASAVEKKNAAAWKLYGVLSTGVVGGADTDGDGRIDVGCVGQNTYTDVRGYSAWIKAASEALAKAQ